MTDDDDNDDSLIKRALSISLVYQNKISGSKKKRNETLAFERT